MKECGNTTNKHFYLKSGFAPPKRNFAPFQVDPFSKFTPFDERKKSTKKKSTGEKAVYTLR